MPKKIIKNSKSVMKLSKDLFKTKKAADLFIEEYANDLSIWKEIFKLYKWKNRRELADRVFSQYIRLKNCDTRWNCICCTCGKVYSRREIQNWHYKSRWDMKYRYSEENCHPQCYKCNVLLNGNYRNYHKYMINKYWEKKEEEIRINKTTIKYTQERYEKSILYWFVCIKDELKKIKK